MVNKIMNSRTAFSRVGIVANNQNIGRYSPSEIIHDNLYNENHDFLQELFNKEPFWWEFCKFNIIPIRSEDNEGQDGFLWHMPTVNWTVTNSKVDYDRIIPHVPFIKWDDGTYSHLISDPNAKRRGKLCNGWFDIVDFKGIEGYFCPNEPLCIYSPNSLKFKEGEVYYCSASDFLLSDFANISDDNINFGLAKYIVLSENRQIIEQRTEDNELGDVLRQLDNLNPNYKFETKNQQNRIKYYNYVLGKRILWPKQQNKFESDFYRSFNVTQKGWLSTSVNEIPCVWDPESQMFKPRMVNYRDDVPVDEGYGNFEGFDHLDEPDILSKMVFFINYINSHDKYITIERSGSNELKIRFKESVSVHDRLDDLDEYFKGHCKENKSFTIETIGVTRRKPGGILYSNDLGYNYDDKSHRIATEGPTYMVKPLSEPGHKSPNLLNLLRAYIIQHHTFIKI